MELQTASHGGYPRIGDKADEQVLRRTIAQRDRGEKTDADVHDAEDAVARQALSEQEAAGLDVISDGLVRWEDAVSHLAGRLEGVGGGGGRWWWRSTAGRRGRRSGR